MKYNIPFVVTSKGRLLTCSDLDCIGDGHNSWEEEFQQLKDSAFQGQNVEIRRGVVSIELNVEQLFTPITIGVNTDESPAPSPANHFDPSLESAPSNSSASSCTDTGAEAKEWDRLYGTESPQTTVMNILKERIRLAEYVPSTCEDIETIAKHCWNVIKFSGQAKDLVNEFTSRDQALLVADLSNAIYDEKESFVKIPLKDLALLDSL